MYNPLRMHCRLLEPSSSARYSCRLVSDYTSTDLAVTRHIPVQRLMLHFRSGLPQVPAKDDADVLHQVARDFDMSHVGRVICRIVVVVLHDAGGVVVCEIV